MNTCVDTPISWLRLESYFLGELDQASSTVIESHVEACDACRSCLQSIQAEQHLPLPGLEVPAPRESLREKLGAWFQWPGLSLTAATAVAVVAAVIWVEPQTTDTGWSGQGVKGDGLVSSLIRERGGRITKDPSGFVSGDRFKLVLTCAPPQTLHWDVAVYQGGEVFFPLEGGQAHCENNFALPGAFTLTGDQGAEICLVTDQEGPILREGLGVHPSPQETWGLDCSRLQADRD